MRALETQKQKEKRVLIYWEELTRLRLDPAASLELVSYIFSISESWIVKIIRLDLADYADVELPHLDLEIALIDAYAKKLQKNAQNKRQANLFSKI